jgi:tRNA modification GTPase
MLRVAILTPAGRGAVATVAVRGDAALAIVQPHFAAASQRCMSEPPAGRIQFGRFSSMGGSEEEIVAVVITPQEIELHCHGGPSAAEAIVQTLVAAGAVRMSWPEWVGRFADPIQAECSVALAAAATERTCAILLDLYHGALAAELAKVDELLASSDPSAHRDARGRIERLLELGRSIGPHLTTPWRVVIAGEPNVGKSSLINAILGYERSIVFDQPGTTRDALSAMTAIDGWPVELIDTAGLRTTIDPLEAAGIERAREQLAGADLVVLVSDATATTGPPAPSGPIEVGNKMDLMIGSEHRSWHERHPGGLLVSAKTGAGIDELCRQISRHLVPHAPRSGEAVPFTPRQLAIVQERFDRSAATDRPHA